MSKPRDGAQGRAEGGLRRASPLRILVLCGLLPVMPPIPRAPPVARERVRPPAPDGPPWKLISPTGVRHVIEDREAIKGVAQTHRPSGGQSPRRALERSPHAMFKLRQKAQCVWLVARWTTWLE